MYFSTPRTAGGLISIKTKKPLYKSFPEKKDRPTRRGAQMSGKLQPCDPNREKKRQAGPGVSESIVVSAPND